MYIENPQGFEVNRKKSHIYRFNKALYGLKNKRENFIIDRWIFVEYGLQRK